MAALPYMQLYIADYLADTAHLTCEEHGAYLLLIFNYWQTGRPIKKDRLSRIVRLPNDRWATVERSLSEFFEDDGECWIHRRVEADLQAVHDSQNQRKAAGVASAKARAQKTKAKKATKTKNCDVLNERSTPAERPLNDRSTNIDTDKDKDKDKDKELKEKQAKEKQESAAHVSAAPTVIEADEVLVDSPPKVVSHPANASANVQAVFAHWQQVMGHPQAKLGDSSGKRYRTIANRLKDGYTVEQLCHAVDGCRRSPFHMGDNDRRKPFNDIELICRDQGKVDDFIRLSQTGLVPREAALIGETRAAAHAFFRSRFGEDFMEAAQ